MLFINVVSCLIFTLLIKPDLAQPALKSYVDEPLFRVTYFMENQIEIWKDVVGYEGMYRVSNLGSVKSLDRKIKNRCRFKGRILKPLKWKGGYLFVTLSKIS